MLKFINNIVSWVLTYTLLAVISMFAYDYMLFDLVKIDISFVNWIGIVTISACIFPNPDKIKVSTPVDIKKPLNPFKNESK